MEELVEVITAAEFHPTSCNLFMYSSSKGVIKLCDLRQNALCDNHSKVFHQPDDPASKSFFSEIIASISDCRFSGDGRYILARDYMTLKIWDLNMDSQPLKVIKIHDHIRNKLCDLYESDSIFDKFECGISADGRFVPSFYRTVFHPHFSFLYYPFFATLFISKRPSSELLNKGLFFSFVLLTTLYLRVY